MIELTIPESWAETRLEYAGSWGSGGTPLKSKKEFYGGNINWLKTGDLNNGVVKEVPDQITKLGLESIGGRLYPPKTIIMAMYGATIGKLGILGIEAAVNQACACCTTYEEIDHKYLFYWLMTYRKEYIALGQGGAQPNISRAVIYDQPFAIPPKKEQLRIVQKIESCFEMIDTTESNLEKIETLLQKYRESLLTKAFRGDLIPQDPSDEPASVLLKKLRSELGNDNSDEFYKLKEEDIPYELPSDWAWCTLPEVGILARGKSKHRPRNDKKLFGGKYPFIQTGDISNADMYVRSHEHTYNEFGLAQSRLFPEGTLCITIAANIGETAILTYPACFPDSIVGYTPHKGYLTSEFVLFFFEFIQNNLERIAPGAAQKNINLEILSKIPFPLPPLRVQKEIERRINHLYHALTKERDSLKSNKNLIKKLKDSILSKAFEGRLVAQIPSEGTGHELLSKISSEKTASRKPQPEIKNKKIRKTSISSVAKTASTRKKK